MENNFIYSWFCFYVKSNHKSLRSYSFFEIDKHPELKQQLCSPLPYIECGKNLNFKLPPNTSDFKSLLHYLTHHKGKLMEKMKDDELQTFIARLLDGDNFSLKHHISVMKCFMRAYSCELAPLMRIRRAFVAMGFSNNIDLDDESFRSIQKHLSIWLGSAAGKGLHKLIQKSDKSLSESDLTKFISGARLVSQLVYCMFFYAQTKLFQFTILVPDVESIIQSRPLSKELTDNHASIVTKAFAEICDNQDIFPVDIDNLSTLSPDNILSSLTIALVFHWIFGNSLKTLENLLKMSSSCTSLQNNPVKLQTRPTSIFINSNNPKPVDSKPNKVFYMSTKSPLSESLSQIFPPRKSSKDIIQPERTTKENKISSDGDTSPEIFLTPTEETPITFSNVTTPVTKLLNQKPTFNSSSLKAPLTKEENSSPMTISLKSEFQKKQHQKMTNAKTKVTVMSANETTWLAQLNKNEINQIPLTPKKSLKSVQSPSMSDSKSLSKAQLNEIQIQLGIQRQKIQNNQKISAKKSEKTLENSKQKAFFQVLNKKPVYERRKSFESENPNVRQQHNGIHAVNTFSMILPTEEYPTNGGMLSETNISENNVSQSESDLPDKIESKNYTKFEKVIENSPEKEIAEDNNHGMELPQSLQESDVALIPAQIAHDVTTDTLSNSTNNKQTGSIPISDANNISEGSMDKRSISRKNSSTSISSLSSASNKESDKILVNQEEYLKSLNILSQSVTSLQEEIRLLKQKQPITQEKSSLLLQTNPIESQNCLNNPSVPETPTNNISLSDITYDAKLAESPSISDPLETNDKLSAFPINNHQLQHSLSHQEPSRNDLCKDKQMQDSISMDNLDDVQVMFPDSSRKPSVETSYGNNNEAVIRGAQVEVMDFGDCTNEVNNNVSIRQSFTNSISDDDGSSNDSISMISNAQPISFTISENQETQEAHKRKAEILARREEKRRLQIEMLKQKRDEERENRLSSTIEELMEREEKKRLEKEKRDVLLQKYLDRKKNENTRVLFNENSSSDKRASSVANTPVKMGVNSKSPRHVGASGKQESVGNLPLASSHRSNWFSSMRISNKKTSQSTSKLHDDMAINDGNKFGVPLPPQEYTGPKLFGKRKVKTNRSVIINAISHCCLAGSVNEPVKEAVLKELADTEGTHFMILFRDSRCQYRALYSFSLASDDLNLIYGSGPKRISHEMVEKFYKYNSGAKQFNLIISTKHLSPAVDAICIQSIYWNNSRPVNQPSTNSQSTHPHVDQSKLKRNLRTVPNTN